MGAGLVGGLAGASLALLGGAAAVLPVEAPVQGQVPAGEGTHLRTVSSVVSVNASELQGSFGFSQSALSSHEDLQRAFKGMSRAVCGTVLAQPEGVVEPIVVHVDGPQPYDATVEQMVERGHGQRAVMSCACAGNQASGDDIVNAQVEGITVKAMAQRAGALSE